MPRVASEFHHPAAKEAVLAAIAEAASAAKANQISLRALASSQSEYRKILRWKAGQNTPSFEALEEFFERAVKAGVLRRETGAGKVLTLVLQGKYSGAGKEDPKKRRVRQIRRRIELLEQRLNAARNQLKAELASAS